ncbi:PepSY domain-containing protein [Myroides sp. 1354]|uniref:PepSY-associated TM helix domain-containing protein n=1 Tax=unclassified Myroides TaxID=2642485 RepID=UPI002574B9DB|nr:MULTISPECIES: PepSY-associated TM helix domain-containing protein [unclassified Myroides]MDM1045521.1 PepSY domain-containing protein [Myroides sp. R163-1]MDM1056523.1 PepSY domain-containing protein [Myroides sp. 1354]MDM1069607.1 PepSY domain-containing protein [Myroides sp. 1372]
MKAKKTSPFRKLMNDLHLWLGIASSLVLFVVCLTGTIYTFKTEIQEWLEPNRYAFVAPNERQAKPVAELVQLVEASTQGKVQRITLVSKEGKPFVFTVSKGEEGKRGEAVHVNPFTGEILGTGKGPGDEFFMTVFKLHRWLLLDSSIGRPIVGIATIIFCFLSISGLILWFPKKIKGWKSIKPGFKIKFNANWKRINHDLHNTLGFYTLLIVLIMSLTGLCWSFEWYRNGLSSVLGAKVFGGRDEVKPESVLQDKSTISLEEALAIANKEMAYDYRTLAVSLPKDSLGAYEINKNDLARWNETVNDRVFIDQYSGEVIKKEIFADKSMGEKLASSIRALHFGDIYGLFSKVIYFITCLIATSLPITGIFIWLNKMKKKPKKKA